MRQITTGIIPKRSGPIRQSCASSARKMHHNSIVAALAKQGLQLIGLLTRRIQTVLIGTLHSDALLEQARQRLSNRFSQNLAPEFEREDAASVSFIFIVSHAYDTGTTVEPYQINNTGEGEELGFIGLVSGTQAPIAKPAPFSPVS